MALLRTALAAVGAALLAALVAAGRSRPETPRPDTVDLPPELPPGRLVRVPGRGDIFIREVPAPHEGAPTVLLLHGWMYPGDLHWFQGYVELAARARLIAPDHRGHGRGTRPSRPFRLTEVADDTAALLRELGTGPVIVLGYSMGGQVAQLLWRRHPDLVEGLILCATSDAYSHTSGYRWLWRGMGLLQVGVRLVPRQWLERLMAAQASGRLPVRVSRMISTETPAAITERLGWVVGEFARGSAEDVAEAGRELSRFDSTAWIGGVDVPAAVVVTANDALVPPAWQRNLAGRLPDAWVVELPLDHDGVVARPDVFWPTVDKAITWMREQG